MRHERPGSLLSHSPSDEDRELEVTAVNGACRNANSRPGRAATIACPRSDTTSWPRTRQWPNRHTTHQAISEIHCISMYC